MAARRTTATVRAAFKMIDPEKPPETVDKIMRSGLMKDRVRGEEGYPRSCLREFEPLFEDTHEFPVSQLNRAELPATLPSLSK